MSINYVRRRRLTRSAKDSVSNEESKDDSSFTVESKRVFGEGVALTVRFLLEGEEDGEGGFMDALVAGEGCSRPYEENDLRSAVKRTCRVSMNLNEKPGCGDSRNAPSLHSRPRQRGGGS
jgi:hypothetical protein